MKNTLRVYESIQDLVGSPEEPTPLVRLNRVRGSRGQIFLKLEWLNPFGSIKDRTAKYLLQGLKDRGLLAGKEIVEPTSGNTGIALVAMANLLGIPCTITIPSGVPEEKITILRVLGANVLPTPDDLCPVDHPKDGAIALAKSFVESPRTKDAFIMPNQYENPDNVKAHYETTGPEIWKQTEGRVTHFFAGYGTCGTITGVAKYLKEKNPAVKVIAIEPQKGHKLPGLKSFEESKKPGILDESLIDDSLVVEDGPAYETTMDLIRKESLLVGPSTGAIIRAAIDFGLDEGAVAVAVSPDNIFKYGSYFAEVVKEEAAVSL
ncbi:MAG: pyridoxal-phosphate dependent enzyme [Deltaproteobacteria bacterium]|nr:pyridoxal-phosphate dependent enzyme [Deltaproteobacteria bacterium]NIS77214.1 pyridoxal-phosphate dependent enzyme [Deltaproteobacteria bacterium]